MQKKIRAVLLSGIVASLLPAIASAYSTKNGNIYDNNGNLYNIDGVAWIGFQDGNILGGLWDTPFSPIGTQNGVIQLMTAPWTVPASNIASAASGVSFKTVRLPIQPGLWHDVTSVQKEPFAYPVTNIRTPTAGNGLFCDWSAGADSSGHCTQPLSPATMLNVAIGLFGANNIGVMLDFHHRPGLGDSFRDGKVVAADYSLQTYHDDVASFAKTAPSNVIGIDIYNEPHLLYWFKPNTSVTPAQPAWITVIAAAASAIYDNNQKLLMFVEAPGGTVNDPYDPVYNSSTAICMATSTTVDSTANIGLGKSSQCSNADFPLRAFYIGSNWGENFRPLLDTAQSTKGIAVFNTPFFRSQLINAIQANKFSTTNAASIADWLLGPNNDGNGGHLVFAPHLYGSAVVGWQTDAHDSPIRFDWNFGFLFSSGFPIVVGELGYDVQMPAAGGEDFFLQSVAPYFTKKGLNHNLYFWTWNRDDTPAGIRTNDSGYGLVAYKEQDLHDFYNATPPTTQTGTLCVTVPQPTGYTGTTLPTVTATGPSAYVFSPTAFDSQVCQSKVLTGNYSLTGSTLTNTGGVIFMPAQAYTATVSSNAQTAVTVNYAQAATGTLQVRVNGDTNCPISATQAFTVGYQLTGSAAGKLTVTGTGSASAVLQAGSYTLTVTPATLPASPNCNVTVSNPVNIVAGQISKAAVIYVYSPPASCTVKATCTTWGTTSDSWSGSSCNLTLNLKNALTSPTIFSMAAVGIRSLTNIWNASGSLQNGKVTLTLSNPRHVNTVGFNATGIIILPAVATVTTGGVAYTCSVTH